MIRRGTNDGADEPRDERNGRHAPRRAPASAATLTPPAARARPSARNGAAQGPSNGAAQGPSNGSTGSPVAAHPPARNGGSESHPGAKNGASNGSHPPRPVALLARPAAAGPSTVVEPPLPEDAPTPPPARRPASAGARARAPAPAPAAASAAATPAPTPAAAERGCLGPLLVGVAASAAAAVALALAWTATDLQVKSVRLSSDAHHQDVMLEPGEELVYCAQGQVRAGEVLARKSNAGRKVEFERVRAEHQATLTGIERVRALPATLEAQTANAAETRRVEDLLGQHESSRTGLRERSAERLEALEMEQQRIERDLVTTNGKCSAAKTDLEQARTEHKRTVELVENQVAPRSGAVDAANKLRGFEQALALAEADRAAVAKSSTYYVEKIAAARADASEACAKEDTAIEELRARQKELHADRAALDEKARGEIDAEQARFKQLATAQEEGLHALERQAENVIVAEIPGQVLRAPTSVPGRPIVVLCDSVALAAEIAGPASAGERLRSGEVRLVLDDGEREQLCQVVSSHPNERGCRVALAPRQIDWATVSDPEGKTLALRAEYGPATRFALAPVAWLAALALGFSGFVLVSRSALSYKLAATGHAPPPSPVATEPARAVPAAAPTPTLQPTAAGTVALTIDPSRALERKLTTVALRGRALDEVTGVLLHETPCAITEPRSAAEIHVEVPVYLLEPGQWHFVLETSSGRSRTASPFVVPAAPRPSIVRVRPAEVAKDAASPPVIEVEGRSFARLERALLLVPDGPGEVACEVARAAAPEPNDVGVAVRLPGDVKPGEYRLVLETRSGRSAESVAVRVLPDASDRVDALLERTLATLDLEELDPAVRKIAQRLIAQRKEGDPGEVAALFRGNPAVGVSAERVRAVHAELAPVLASEPARRRATELRESGAASIARLLAVAYSGVVGSLEPRSRTPSQAEIDEHVGRNDTAGRLLQLGKALVWDEAEGQRLEASLLAALVVYRERQLPQVFSKVKERLASILGETFGQEEEELA